MDSELDATLRTAIISQYSAALEMMRQTILKCPDSFWYIAPIRNQFWRVAYHVLFYTHFYLHPTEKDFVPWLKHRNEVESYVKEEPEQPDAKSYSREESLEYLDFCLEQVQSQIAGLDLHAASGFSWLPFNKLELQFYNIRHLQQHVGELSEQLSDKTGIEITWVGSKSPNHNTNLQAI